MRIGKRLLFMLAFLFFYGTSFAGELAAKEAVNYFNAGLEAQKAKRYSDAEINYRKTVLVNPANKKWPLMIANNRGVISIELGDLDSAAEYFLAALEIDPNFKPAQINYGFVLDKTASELDSMKYWMNLLNIDLQKLKPAGLVLAVEEVQQKKE